MSVSDERGLIDYLRAVSRWTPVIVAIGLVSAGAAYVFAARTQPSYEASVTVLLSRSRIGDAPSDAPLPTASFRTLLENRTEASGVIDELGLADPPFSLTPAGLVDGNMTIEDVKNTNFLKIRVRLSNPAIVVKLANRLVERAVALNSRLNAQQETAAQDLVKREMERTRATMDDAQNRLLEYKRAAQVEVSEQDTQTVLDQRGRVLQLMLDIEAERARLAKAEEELGRQPPALAAARSPALENTIAVASREPAATSRESEDSTRTRAGSNANASSRPPTSSASDPASVLQFGSGVANPVYQILQYQIVESRTKLSSLERTRDELVKTKGITGSEVAALRELHRKQFELTKRQVDYDLAARIYGDMASRYEQSKILVTARSATASIVDPAIAADGPLTPRPMRAAAEAAVIGFLLASMAFVLWEAAPRWKL